MQEHFTMSKKELDRVAIMDRIAERRLRQTEAAEMLGLSPRQVGRLYRAYRRDGAGALASRKRGRTSNRKHPESLKQQALALVRSHYADFGPTLACEKLREIHGVVVATETLRLWMTEAEIWVPRSQRAKRSYQPRQRRACLGELVQVDGSKHAWFEDRAEPCALLVYIDDATGALMELRFAQSEATFDYFEATRSYLHRYGKPVAFYSDRHSIFHVNARDKARRGAGLSQFGRALADLNIDIVCANSPQAKGRVERANGILQDRLVKELRLAGIASREQAGPTLEAFRLDYNRRFARLPRSERDAHRPLADHEDLTEVFTLQTDRRITSELLLHYKRMVYVIQDTVENRKLRGARATVSEHENGDVVLACNGRRLAYRVHPKDNARITQGSVVENKRLDAVLHVIARQQLERDRQRLANPKITLRDKARIRRAVTL
jgi:transposase